MFCPKCGKINPDNSEICSGCNAPLHDENEKSAPAKKTNWGRILLVVAIIVIAAVVVTLVINGCGSTKIPEETMTF